MTLKLIERNQAEVAQDAVALARRAGIEPDKWQADVLRSKAQQMILLCARQSGKSTVTSLLALRYQGTTALSGLKSVGIGDIHCTDCSAR